MPSLRLEILRMRSPRTGKLPSSRRVPLGLMLMSRGEITASQLTIALDKQKSSGSGKIGEWLIQLGYVGEPEVLGALGAQWGCPVLNLSAERLPDCVGLLPLKLLECHHMLPVQFVLKTRILYLGCSLSIDHSAMYSIEKMLACKTAWCAVGQSTVGKLLQKARQEIRMREVIFDSFCPEDEVVRFTLAYGLKLGTQVVRVTRSGEYLWVRLVGGDQQTDLLFRA